MNYYKKLSIHELRESQAKSKMYPDYIRHEFHRLYMHIKAQSDEIRVKDERIARLENPDLLGAGIKGESLTMKSSHETSSSHDGREINHNTDNKGFYRAYRASLKEGSDEAIRADEWTKRANTGIKIKYIE